MEFVIFFSDESARVTLATMPRNLADSPLMKPFVVLALPGMYLFYKYNQYKQQQQEQCKRKVTERELAQLNHKIVSENLAVGTSNNNYYY